MGILGTLKMCPPTAQSTMHLPNKTIKRALLFTMIHCMVLCTHILESINNTKHIFYVILYLFNHALICIFFGKGAHHTSPLHSLETMVFISF